MSYAVKNETQPLGVEDSEPLNIDGTVSRIMVLVRSAALFVLRKRYHLDVFAPEAPESRENSKMIEYVKGLSVLSVH
jgi:hypothetical protein